MNPQSRDEVLVCKGYVWECDGEPPDIGECGMWLVPDARLRADGFAADCLGPDGDQSGMQHIELKRAGATEFAGRWKWKGMEGPAKAVLYDVGDRVYGSASWHDPFRGVSGRWMFELEVVKRLHRGLDEVSGRPPRS